MFSGSLAPLIVFPLAVDTVRIDESDLITMHVQIFRRIEVGTTREFKRDQVSASPILAVMLGWFPQQQ